MTISCMKKQSITVQTEYARYMWRIKFALSQQGKTQKDLADSLGMDTANLSKILACAIEPGLSFFFKVREYFRGIGFKNSDSLCLRF